MLTNVHFDYPIDPRPRYGHGKPPHKQLLAIIGAHRERYAMVLESFLKFQPYLSRISAVTQEDNCSAPHWLNDYLPGMDAVSLYSLIADRRPARYCEIGSGNSTRFARQAV